MMQLPFVSRKKYDEVVYKLECLLCHVTGSKLSKASYDLGVMESWANAYLMECIDEALIEAEEAHRWIPVHERLPERQCEVLVYYHFDNENDSKGEARFSDRSFVSVLTYFKYDAKPHFQHESTGLCVTHWMPLPELPKGEKEA